jgi:hypothetical protein
MLAAARCLGNARRQPFCQEACHDVEGVQRSEVRSRLPLPHSTISRTPAASSRLANFTHSAMARLGLSRGQTSAAA